MEGQNMTEGKNTRPSSVVDEIHAAREAYKQELDHSYWKLVKALFEGFHNEYAALTAATDDHPSFHDDAAYEWLYRFDQAQQAARSLVALIPLLCEMGMPIYHAQIEALISLYVFDPMLGQVPSSVDFEQMKDLLNYRLMNGTGEPISRNVDDFDGGHLDFMLMGEQSSLSGRVISNTQNPDGPHMGLDGQL
jgi:hypothetical protein